MRTNREQLRNHRLPLSKRYVRTKQLALFGSQATEPNAKLLPYHNNTHWSAENGNKPILNATSLRKRAPLCTQRAIFYFTYILQVAGVAYNNIKWPINAYGQLFKRRHLSVKI